MEKGQGQGRRGKGVSVLLAVSLLPHQVPSQQRPPLALLLIHPLLQTALNSREGGSEDGAGGWPGESS